MLHHRRRVPTRILAPRLHVGFGAELSSRSRPSSSASPRSASCRQSAAAIRSSAFQFVQLERAPPARSRPAQLLPSCSHEAAVERVCHPPRVSFRGSPRRSHLHRDPRRGAAASRLHWGSGCAAWKDRRGDDFSEPPKPKYLRLNNLVLEASPRVVSRRVPRQHTPPPAAARPPRRSCSARAARSPRVDDERSELEPLIRSRGQEGRIWPDHLEAPRAGRPRRPWSPHHEALIVPLEPVPVAAVRFRELRSAQLTEDEQWAKFALLKTIVQCELGLLTLAHRGRI